MCQQRVDVSLDNFHASTPKYVNTRNFSIYDECQTQSAKALAVS